MFSIFKRQGVYRLFAIMSVSLILQIHSSVSKAMDYQSQVYTEGIIAEMLKTAIVTSVPEAEQKIIHEFYQFNLYGLIWLNNKEIESALQLLSNVNEQGLKSRDYNTEWLNIKWKQLQNTLSPSFEQLTEFDVALSQHLLRYLSDLTYGRINPKKVEFGFEVERNSFKLAEETLSAINSGKLKEFAKNQEPQFVFYQNLKHALHIYQKAYKKHANTIFNFSKTLTIGTKDEQIPLLRQYLTDLGDFIKLKESDTKDTSYDVLLADAVKNFQKRHGLNVTGKLGKKTLEVLNIPLKDRIFQIELGLERLRWVPKYEEDRLVFVNVPSFQLWAFNSLSDKKARPLNMRVVVGKAKKHQTPIFSAKMKYLAFRPYWNVPQSIIKNEIMPKVRANPNYLAQKGMEKVGHSIRQRPGTSNALGLVKFMFPNRHAVYLHDTPSKKLFNRTRRDFSHGCIRVAEPITLAEFALEKQSNSTWSEDRVKKAMYNGNNRHVPLDSQIPVVIFYSTVMATDKGAVHFLNDIYGLDDRLKRELNVKNKQS